jgi:serine/threonine-protein kinase
MANTVRTRATVLCFGDFSMDLSTGLLLKRGVRVRLREQSFQVLASLLEHPGQVSTREDLRRRLWQADVFVDFENNLNAAVGRLREALGDSANHPRFIETVPKRGYRFIGTLVDEPPVPRAPGARCRRRWRPAAGLEVPGTPWVLEERLGHGAFGEVWLGRHCRLREPRVFKFCVGDDRVRALKREMTLFRLWRARVGDHPHLVQLLGVNLDRPPFYLEEEYVAGRDLRTWCAAQGGVGKVPVGVRFELMAQAADGLAAAHEAGIVHRDIKPGNILVSWRQSAAPRDPFDSADELSTGRDAASAVFPVGSPEGVARELAALGFPTAKVADFGIGHVMSAQALAGITATGLTATSGPVTSAAVLGTHAYLAPELLMGRPATAQSDLYAMGVMLYQLLVEDFTQPVPTDWARAIPDAVVQEDLQCCLAGRPEERFGSARELAAHLRSLSARQEARARTSKRAFEQGDTHIASLAVLPFANLSADPDNESLSDGIAEDLLVALARVPGLRVPGRTSCFAFKGKTEDVRRIGRELGVETVLEGSVRRVDGRLRITAQLINVADGLHLWSERYDRRLADVFAVQDAITQAIAVALIPKLSGHSLALVKPYTGSVDAYELCLRARYQHQKRTPAGLAEALRLFEQAAARDPDCAPAYAGLAHVCLLLCYFGGLETRDGMPRVRAAAARALELDDSLPVTHTRMADALCFGDWDWAGAEREYLRALELDPDSTEALCRYGLFLWAKQRHHEALVLLRKALDLDPFSFDANWFIGWVYLSLRRLDEAEDVAHKMVRLDPNSWIGYQLLAWTESVRGKWPAATAAYERSAAIEGGPASLSVLCWCYEKSGRPLDARHTLERLELLTTTRIVPPTWLALAYDGVGADAQASACMMRALEERHMLVVPLRSFIALTGWLSPYRTLLDDHGL